MAVNEYLTRTPTSSGNRYCWTLSFWIKRNAVAADQNPENTSGAFFNFYTTQAVSPYESVANFNSNGTIQLARNQGGSDHELSTTNVFRDIGNWMHILIKWDVTKGVTQERVKLYVNGVIQDDVSGTFPSLNYLGSVNNIVQHTIGTVIAGGVPYAPSGPSMEYFDWFLVDGQALGPDVFGFYKDGDGYVSAGSSIATDFRPGQWMPHSPSKIKKDINRRGGFGVNGFYLPMNDSSNPGADFHCTPNSIIKLKGEDLPQPRNGAPTTSDAYVSQLRSDPFSANLVLAVPGASTATGANLVTNGHFDTNTTGWTATNSAVLSVDNGTLKVLNTAASYGRATKTITGLESGKRYSFSVDMIYGNASYITTLDGASGTINPGWQSADYVWRVSFTAVTTSLTITFQVDAVNTKYGFWDNVVLKQEDAPRDYSADIKGSGTNKTLTAAGNVGVGYELGGYYGSAVSFPGTYNHNIPLGANTDFAFGTGDFTVEFWFYTNEVSRQRILSSTQGGFLSQTWVIRTEPTNTLGFYSNNTINPAIVAAANQWHHVAVTREGLFTSLYLNGVCIGVDVNDTKNYTEAGTNNFWLASGYTVDTATENFNGYIQDLRVYKGVAKYKGGFDVPKPYTPVGIEAFRTNADTCKNNFATLNPLVKSSNTFANGNLTSTMSASTPAKIVSTIGVSTGKWYAEYYYNGNANYPIGISADSISRDYLGMSDGSTSVSFWINPTGTQVYINGSLQSFSGSATTWASGDIAGLSLDHINKEVSLYKNGILVGSAWSYSSYNWTNAFFAGGNYISGNEYNINFGQNPSFSGTTTAGTNTDSNGKGLFKYAPPSGFLALCEDNLTTPAITDPGDHFKCVLYTGSSVSGSEKSRSISGLGFKPDLVWLKSRSVVQNHQLYDSVRGFGGGKGLSADENRVEGDIGGFSDTDYGFVSAADDNGFSVLSTHATGTWVNSTGVTYVAWCWKAGGAAVTNSDGTLTSQVSVNQTAGFSIVKFTGQGGSSSATVGHGLGKKPAFWIYKPHTNTTNWYIYHQSLGASAWLMFTSGAATTSNPAAWGGVEPTSTVLTHGSGLVNQGSCILYAWAEIEGYSKFGSYVGNGNNTDGPFVYCGFKPAWVIVKCTSVANGNWIIYDSSRCSTNINGLRLGANHDDLENQDNTYLGSDNSFGFDLLSNGFKVRTGGVNQNNNNETYIFMAFAESPFQTANAK